jgi:UDP-glucose 4-epimerase
VLPAASTGEAATRPPVASEEGSAGVSGSDADSLDGGVTDLNRRVLVTGGAGFIGSNLVDALVARGDTVTVLDDLSTGRQENLAEAGPGVRFLQGSILDRPLVESLLADVDTVYHLAVRCLRVCFDRPHLVHEVNATGTLNVLEALRQHNPSLRRFVYVSSSEIYGTSQTDLMSEDHVLEPTTVYGSSKLAGELYTRNYYSTYGLPTTIVRPFNTYGPREHHEGASGEVIPRFLVRILNGQAPVIFGDGSQARDFTYVTETVEGILRVAEADLLGQTVNVARGQDVSIRRIAELLLELLDVRSLGIEHAPERPSDVLRHHADVSKLERLTGWRPTIDIEEGLRRYVDWFRRQYDRPEELLDAVPGRNWQVPQPDRKPVAP